jgi:hypothetical protein
MGVRFTEEMKGWCTFGATDYVAGADEGRRAATNLMFHLTISVDDLDRFRSDPLHEAVAVGWIGCPALGDGTLPISEGRFNLFAPGLGPGRTTMRYRLFFQDALGEPLTLVGYKDVGDDPGFDLWKDTTSLYTRLLKGHVAVGDDDSAEVRAMGLLFIPALDFAKQLTTFRGRLPQVLRFAGMFVSALTRTYAGRSSKKNRS